MQSLEIITLFKTNFIPNKLLELNFNFRLKAKGDDYLITGKGLVLGHIPLLHTDTKT